jgi:hypothetical protein
LARETWNWVRALGVLELAHGEVGHVELPGLGDHDESLARHLQHVGLLNVTGQDEDQDVARAELVVLVHRARVHRLELGREPAEGLDAEDLELGRLHRLEGIGERIGAQGVEMAIAQGVEHLPHRVRDRVHRVGELERVELLRGEDAERLDRVERAGTGTHRERGVGTGEIIVEE